MLRFYIIYRHSNNYISIFLFYNILGGVLWVFGVSMLGYILGGMISNADKYILPIVLVIIFISVIPLIIKFIKSKYIKK